MSSSNPSGPRINATQVVAGASASAIGFFLATQLGVLGTIVGAAFISIVATISSAYVQHYLDRGRRLVSGGAVTAPKSVITTADNSAAAGQSGAPPAAGGTHRAPSPHRPTPQAAPLDDWSDIWKTAIPADTGPTSGTSAESVEAAPTAATPRDAPSEQPRLGAPLPTEGVSRSAVDDFATEVVPGETPRANLGDDTQLLPRTVVFAAEPPSDAHPTKGSLYGDRGGDAPGLAAVDDAGINWKSRRLWIPAVAIFGMVSGAAVAASLVTDVPGEEPRPSPVQSPFATATVTPPATPEASPTATESPTLTPTPTLTPGTSPSTAPTADPEPTAEVQELPSPESSS